MLFLNERKQQRTEERARERERVTKTAREKE